MDIRYMNNLFFFDLFISKKAILASSIERYDSQQLEMPCNIVALYTFCFKNKKVTPLF